MIRRSIFDKVGGFDEIYKNGLEDVDLCLKVKYLGLKAVYCPESIVYHYESLSKGRSEHDDENAEIFMSRWASKIHIDYTEYALVDGTDGLGKFLANQIGKNGKTKRLLYLAKTFCVVMWRDGYSIATKKAMRRIR
jgi:GT2 family glycosyltransferase